MSASESSQTTLHADQEHSGLRIGVLAVLVIGFILLFLLLSFLMNEFGRGLLKSYAPGISCFSALILALGITAIAEAYMKSKWHSGRSVTVDDTEIFAILKDNKQIKFQWDRRLAITRWYFSLKGYPKAGREKRVPSKYFCLATQLQQGGERIVVYTFLPPKRTEACLASSEFVEIKPGDVQDSNIYQRWRGSFERPELPKDALMGNQGPYWLAEQRRWTEGLELAPDDFELFMTIVDSRGHE
jgi:hypothetical protein